MRINLIEISSDHLDFIYQGLSDPDVIRYYGVSFDSLEATKEQMKWYHNLITNRKGHWWLLSDEQGNLLGAAGYNDWDHVHRKAEVGFWLIPVHWGKGIMKEAMKEILRIGFEDMQLNRVEGFVETENLKCKRAMEKIGFKREAVLEDYEMKNGQYINIEVYGMLSSDFDSIKNDH